MMPKFSIILPLRNSGNYLNECVNSILDQSYTDYELLILAHDSDPDTLNYLHSIQDERVKIIYAENVDGITGNWARIKDVAKSEYMTIIGYDDVLKPNFLEVINELIKRYPDASLYHTHFDFIDSKGLLLRSCKLMKEVQSPEEVIANYVGIKSDLMATGFVMRSRDYEKIGGIPLYKSLLFADMEFIIEMSRLSYLAVTPKNCFSYRKHTESTTNSSSIVNYIKGFEQFLNYLIRLKNENEQLKKNIDDSGKLFLDKCGEYIAAKLLTSPASLNPVTIKDFIVQLKNQGDRVCGINNYDPLNNKKLKLALMIERNEYLRSLFTKARSKFRK